MRLSLTVLSLFDTITVAVGDAALKYTVYTAVIRKSSKFFDSATKPEWTKSRPDSGIIDLTDEDPATFELYLHWLYFKTFAPSSRRTPRTALPSTKRSVSAMCWVRNSWKTLSRVRFWKPSKTPTQTVTVWTLPRSTPVQVGYGYCYHTLSSHTRI